jgi:biopolymer transport protein ExbD
MGLIIIRIMAVTKMKVEIKPCTLYERQKITNHLSAMETSKRIVISVDKKVRYFLLHRIFAGWKE